MGKVLEKKPKPKRQEETVKAYVPKTPLGKRLLAIRKKIIASGVPLLSIEEIRKEIAESRGEDD